jgi:large subunit ribosomal protein L6
LLNKFIVDMSRIAKQPVNYPDSVEVSVKDDNVLFIKGANGDMELTLISAVNVDFDKESLTVKPTSSSKFARSAAGTFRSLINNMVIGVTEGFTKELELVGVGYRAKMEGSKLNLTLGFSHPVSYQIPEGIKVTTPTQTEISIKGVDKQKVGQVAAELRSIRPPEPYKGKGVRYKDEKITLKETKKQV